MGVGGIVRQEIGVGGGGEGRGIGAVKWGQGGRVGGIAWNSIHDKSRVVVVGEVEEVLHDEMVGSHVVVGGGELRAQTVLHVPFFLGYDY